MHRKGYRWIRIEDKKYETKASPVCGLRKVKKVEYKFDVPTKLCFRQKWIQIFDGLLCIDVWMDRQILIVCGEKEKKKSGKMEGGIECTALRIFMGINVSGDNNEIC